MTPCSALVGVLVVALACSLPHHAAGQAFAELSGMNQVHMGQQGRGAVRGEVWAGREAAGNLTARQPPSRSKAGFFASDGAPAAIRGAPCLHARASCTSTEAFRPAAAPRPPQSPPINTEAYGNWTAQLTGDRMEWELSVYDADQCTMAHIHQARTAGCSCCTAAYCDEAAAARTA